MPVLSIGDKRLGAVLLDSGYVSDDNLQQAIQRHAEVGGRLSDILVQLGVISEQRIARAIEEAIGIPTVVLTRTDIMSEALSKVPADLAQDVSAVPFAFEGGRLKVAFADPLDAMAIEEIEDAAECHVEPYKALSKEIAWALAIHYPELGLEPPEDYESDAAQRLGMVAIEKKLISQEQLDAAIAEQQKTSGLLGRILIKQGAISEQDLAKLLAEQAGLRYIASLKDVPPSEKLANNMLRIDAVQFSAVPYREHKGKIVIALSDPRRVGDIEAVIERPILFVCSPESEVQQRIDAMYADDKGRLGETLLENKKIKREQLRKALREQSKTSGANKAIGEILVEMGFIAEEEVEEALKKQQEGGGKLEDTLVQSGKISPDMLARSLAMQLGYDYVDDNVRVDPYAVTLVPEGTVRRYLAVPIRIEKNTLVVAMKDPRHVFALDDIKLITGKDIQPAVASEETLIGLINRFYRGSEDMDELTQAMLEEVGGREEEIEDDSAIDDNALVKVVNSIIREAVLNDISDIHIEPRPDKIIVRVRKDGALREYMTLPRATAGALAARIKIMGGLNIAEKRVPQDGRVRFKDKTLEVDLRLSTLPTVYGEKSVMRILKKADSIPEIEQLGFADYNFQRFEDVIHKPYGMFLITGPTGSGKSFTTFSVLKRIAKPEVNVTTVEDPVEYEIPGINQTQTNVKAGLTFASALRSFLRQDPDIIMVGEIRDTETAKTAVEAALTGHLLIATLHTNDSSGAVTRLHEMGIETFNIAASLLGVLAQRLVRRVCKECKVEYSPDPNVLRQLGLREDEVVGKTLYRGVGCDKCSGTGYSGRAAIHELLSINDEVATAIVKGLSSTEIKQVAIQGGMTSLRGDGINKAFKGITTLEEVLAKTTD